MSQSSTIDRTLQSLKIIDADTHLTERHDLWTSRAPSAWKELVPQVKTIDGENKWVINGDHIMGIANPASVVRPDLSKVQGMDFMSWQIDDCHPASYDAKARLAVMDEQGVWAQILYPNLLGFGGRAASILDPKLRLLTIQLYNDAMAEFQEESGQRLFPMGIIPWWDAEASVAEVRRIKDLGLRGINTNPAPNEHGLPDLGSTTWDPIWEVCSDYNLPVNFHIGASDESIDWFGSGPWPSQTENQKLALGSALIYFTNAKVISNLIYCGLLERFPKLNFVSVESGIGWIPFMLEALDYQMRETAPEMMDTLSMAPSDYFRRQIHACFWFEREEVVQNIKSIGVDNCMFETDFPHPTCLYPNPIQHAAAAFSDEDEEICRKVMGGNAARLYSIPLE